MASVTPVKLDMAAAYVSSIRTRLGATLGLMKSNCQPDVYSTEAKYGGIQYGPMCCSQDEEQNIDPKLIMKYEKTPHSLRMIEEAEDGTISILIWPKHLIPYVELMKQIDHETAQAMVKN